MLDAALLSYLLGLASSLSGYPPLSLDDLPTVRMLSMQSFSEEVCPGEPSECTRLVAYYDRAREQILVRSDLQLQDSADNSFLLHEFVHVLEARQKGFAYQRDCRATLQSERDAYRAQNAYLSQQGRFERFGGMLAHMICSRDQPGGSGSMKLEMAPAGMNDERALESFMQDLEGAGASSARRR
jgi:hypothetical protein